jgi:hypothetical protein
VVLEFVLSISVGFLLATCYECFILSGTLSESLKLFDGTPVRFRDVLGLHFILPAIGHAHVPVYRPVTTCTLMHDQG